VGWEGCVKGKNLREGTKEAYKGGGTETERIGEAARRPKKTSLFHLDNRMAIDEVEENSGNA